MNEKIDKLFEEMKKAKCIFPNCPERPIIVSVEVKKKGLNLGIGIPMCFTHMTYYQSGDLDFEFDKDLNVKAIKYSDNLA